MTDNLIACHYCDLLVRRSPCPPHRDARCPRCGGGLYQCKENTVNRSLAVVIAGIFLYIPANFTPIFILKSMGNVRFNTMFTGVAEFGRQGLWDIAFLVLMSSIMIPLLKLGALFYVLLTVRFSWRKFGAPWLLRLHHNLDEWGMLEVFMLALLVALTKLDAFAEVYIGFGFYCFIGLLVTTWMTTIFLDEEYLWQQLEDLQ